MSARRRRILLPGRGFDPEWPLHNLPDLAAWYTFDDADYLFADAGSTKVTADGDKIYQCNDRSGNDYHVVQSTEANRPLWKLNIQGGRAVGRFDGANDFMLHGDSIITDEQDCTLVAVVSVAGTKNSPKMNTTMSNCASDGSGYNIAIASSSSTGTQNQLRADTYEPSGSGIDIGTFALNVFGIASVHVDGTTRFGYKNGALTDSGTAEDYTGGTAPDRFAVGNLVPSGDFHVFHGDIAELIVCNADIGYGALRALWQRYLGPKWNLPV